MGKQPSNGDVDPAQQTSNTEPDIIKTEASDPTQAQTETPVPPTTAQSAKLVAVKTAVTSFKHKLKKGPLKKRKHVPAAIMRRRHDVWEMMCQGIPRVEMSKILNVHEHTVGDDVRYWKESLASRVARMKDTQKAAHIELGLTVQKLDSIVEAAFQEYSTSKNESSKDKFLNTAMKALATKIRILQETGFLPKAGIEIKAEVRHEASFSDRFGLDSPMSALDDPTSRHKVLAIAARLIRLAETQQPIDVDAIAKDAPQLPFSQSEFLGGIA